MLYLLHDWLRNWLEDVGLYRLTRVLDQVQFRALAAAGLAFALVVVLGPMVIRRLRALKIGDTGETDAEALRAHAASKASVPTMGGLLICGAVLISAGLLANITEFYLVIGLVVVVWLAGVGGADDWLKMTSAKRGGGRQGLYAWEKFAFQVGVGLLAGFFAYRQGVVVGADGVVADSIAHVLNLPGQRTYADGAGGPAAGLMYLPRVAYVGLAVLMIAGLSNAVNITDGMDGLAAGTGATVSFGLLLLTLAAGSTGIAHYLRVPYVPGTDELAVLAGALAGACLGFLWWNCSPAQVFMGDTGSLPLGGVIGYIAMVTRQEFIVLIMCGVFLLEIASVVIQVGYFRATGGKRVFRCAPIHHHFHLGGWTEQQTVARFWIVSIILALLGLATLKLR